MAVQDVTQPEELDLTGYHLHNLSEVSIPENVKVIWINVSIAARGPTPSLNDGHGSTCHVQGLDLMTNRLRDIDERILALTGGPQHHIRDLGALYFRAVSSSVAQLLVSN